MYLVQIHCIYGLKINIIIKGFTRSTGTAFPCNCYYIDIPCTSLYHCCILTSHNIRYDPLWSLLKITTINKKVIYSQTCAISIKLALMITRTSLLIPNEMELWTVIPTAHSMMAFELALFGKSTCIIWL